MAELPGWIGRLERRLGPWALENLGLFIVAMNAAVWALSLVKPDFPSLLALDPALLVSGQPWRALTFLFVPPTTHPVWMLLWLYLLFVYAGALEREWGDFRFNLFYLLGALALLGASLATGRGLSNMPLNASIFLAFAALFPDFELLLFFVLPVKVKWLAAFAWAGILWTLLAGSWDSRLTTAAGILNYAVFFGPAHARDLRGRLRRRRW
ncbi:MAG: Rhomboid family protein [Elusimicrobiota bacterium]|jgi:hypothetical protein